ncbi:MAG: response regulator [Phycisphaerae bacterium]|nr:response regulator [Phycisphaerae bacterium]
MNNQNSSVRIPRPRILIADDDPALLRALTIRLTHEGYDVITASDGYNALARAMDERPDLMILDINMPAGDGFTVQERFENSSGWPRVPTIYISGDKSDVIRHRFRQAKGFALLHKPLDGRHLIEMIQRALWSCAA